MVVKGGKEGRRVAGRFDSVTCFFFLSFFLWFVVVSCEGTTTSCVMVPSCKHVCWCRRRLRHHSLAANASQQQQQKQQHHLHTFAQSHSLPTTTTTHTHKQTKKKLLTAAVLSSKSFLFCLLNYFHNSFSSQIVAVKQKMFTTRLLLGKQQTKLFENVLCAMRDQSTAQQSVVLVGEREKERERTRPDRDQTHLVGVSETRDALAWVG